MFSTHTKSKGDCAGSAPLWFAEGNSSNRYHLPIDCEKELQAMNILINQASAKNVRQKLNPTAACISSSHSQPGSGCDFLPEHGIFQFSFFDVRHFCQNAARYFFAYLMPKPKNSLPKAFPYLVSKYLVNTKIYIPNLKI